MAREPSKRHRQQRGKNYALLAVLLAIIVLFYVLTLVRMGGAH
jgi:predicted anti-sigma-YlaC factor YlaD